MHFLQLNLTFNQLCFSLNCYDKVLLKSWGWLSISVAHNLRIRMLKGFAFGYSKDAVADHLPKLTEASGRVAVCIRSTP